MDCPVCGKSAEAGDRFCEDCGTGLTGAPAGGAGETHTAQPTQPMPAAQVTQVMPPVQQGAPPASPPGTYLPPVAPPPPPPPSSAGPIIAVILGAVLVLGLATTAGFLLMRSRTSVEPSATDQTTSTAEATAAAEATTGVPPRKDGQAVSGYATAREAVEAYLPIDWSYDLLEDNVSSVEYVAGPPESEYTDVIVVARRADGSWEVVDTYEYDMGDIDPQGGVSTESEARDVVQDFILAVQQDRADDAHALTVAPFSDDPASASYSNGDLLSFDILDTVVGNDGTTVHVRAREVWRQGDQEWTYVCVPTPNGYRIGDLIP